MLDKLELTVDWRIYALQTVDHLLKVESGDDPGEEPTPPDDPVVQERVTAVRVLDSRAAIEAPKRPCVSTAEDIARLADADLRSLGELVANELDTRKIYD